MLRLSLSKRKFFSGAAEFVTVPGIAGELGIYPRHAPLLTRIKPGTVRIKLPAPQQDEFIFIAGGLLEVQPHTITVLADTAIRGADLDEAQANATKKLAEENLAHHHANVDYAKVEAELAIAVAQLATIQKLRRNHKGW